MIRKFAHQNPVFLRNTARILHFLALSLLISCGNTSEKDDSSPPADNAPILETAEPNNLSTQINAMYGRYKADAFPDTPDISVAQLLTSEKENPDPPYLLVDCRTPDEQAVSVIPDSITRSDFDAHQKNYTERTVVVYCTIGYRSGLYTRELNQRGIKALNLKGGVLAWALARQPFLNPETNNETKRVHVFGPDWNLLPPDYTPVF